MIKTFLVDYYGVIRHPQDDPFSVWNEVLLDFLCELSEKSEMYMFTNSVSASTDEVVLEKLQPLFIKIFSANKMSLSKEDASSYTLLVKKIGKQPSEILFIDDSVSNVEAAKSAGLNAVVYTSFEKLHNELHELNKLFY